MIDHVALESCAPACAPRNEPKNYNLVAEPDAEIEIGTDRFPVRARVAEGEERDRIFEKQKADWDGFARPRMTAARLNPLEDDDRNQTDPLELLLVFATANWHSSCGNRFARPNFRLTLPWIGCRTEGANGRE